MSDCKTELYKVLPVHVQTEITTM